ncbi:hypothetical protein GCM10011507_11150 [Edaphobacter acidisoli]|uniref:Uncharacterized protein n=1 Tax=Edaphobacter acidisoli TaxID=2040573 RepID=A0A916RPH7_9BACT|nr:hypothetical protein [Edaphobacter acidisoli]GGA61418.1 hypothetical protein GCM10011507_11150 [Edaphobacter acidisoli]
MAIVVVGGHSKNVGKTSVVAGLIAAMPEMRWTAIKVSVSGHGICSGENCDCVNAAHTVAVTEEKVASTETDSGRFLAAGAARSFWVRTRAEDLAEAMPWIRRELEQAENAVIESNSVLEFLQPDIYLSVIDPAVEDFKDSAQRFLECADAVLMPEDATLASQMELAKGTAVLPMRPPVYVTRETVEFVRKRLKF